MDAISRPKLIRDLIRRRNVLYNMMEGSYYRSRTPERVAIRLKAIDDIIAAVRAMPSVDEMEETHV